MGLRFIWVLDLTGLPIGLDERLREEEESHYSWIIWPVELRGAKKD